MTTHRSQEIRKVLEKLADAGYEEGKEILETTIVDEVDKAMLAIESLMPNEIEEGEIFTKIKSIISDCICKTVVFVGVNIPEKPLNLLANEYTDKILSILTSLGRKKRENE